MRDLGEPNKPSHISYKEYQKKVTNSPNTSLVLFVSAFFVMLLLFLGVARQLSPDVDVAIGDDMSEEQIAKRSVDDRLKLIQMEDNQTDLLTGNKDNEDIFANEPDEKVKIPEHNKKQENLADKEIVLNNNADRLQVQTQTPSVQQSAQPTTAKVVVGYYATPQQAEVAKTILLDSGIQGSPFVKNIGGAYTLQIGSFKSREQAQSVANELLRNNFPARVIVE